MALSKERDTVQFGAYPDPGDISLPVAAATKLYQGGLVCDNNSGYATKGAVSTTLKAIGIATQTVDNSSGSAGDLNVTVRRGAVWLANSSGDAVAITDRYDYCYMEDDQTVSATDGGGTQSIAGIVLDVDSDRGVLVLVGAATQALVSTISAKAIQKRTVTVDHADLTAGASSIEAVGAALPTNAVVLGHELVITEAFAGEADVAVNLGGTDDDAIIDDYSLDSVTAGTYAGDAGAAPQGTYSAQQLNLTFTATALEDLTAGTLTCNVWFFVLA